MTFKYHNLFLPTNIPISFYNTKENIIFVVKLNQYVMDISKFSKAEVLATLYNRAKPQGLGLLQFDPKPMTIREAEILLAESANHYFDYVKGRVN